MIKDGAGHVAAAAAELAARPRSGWRQAAVAAAPKGHATAVRRAEPGASSREFAWRPCLVHRPYEPPAFLGHFTVFVLGCLWHMVWEREPPAHAA